ncbi:hypothetical protein [Natranaeroarchaeum aerophilus]|uniref:DUF8152 domain-containing protein n=1 Tax=Natranaeroarchaeum aerophilus TaxID=2917711 RepID=A0AAE3K325_9EURY|nr:hypothetical protein [Natranaeroarchaeum aerophilus]MCL9812337.1 hypothetical protein [Natranaeroarchaeum aerophilus]
MTDDRQALTAELYSHLKATAERPVDRDASRWIGEAEAIAGDIAGADVSPDVIGERIGHVDRLLSEIDTTGDPAADEHVDEAKRLVGEIHEALDDG